MSAQHTHISTAPFHAQVRAEITMQELLKTFRSVNAIDAPGNPVSVRDEVVPHMAPSVSITETAAATTPERCQTGSAPPAPAMATPALAVPISPTPTLTAEQLIALLAEAEVAASIALREITNAEIHQAFSTPLEPSQPHCRQPPPCLRAHPISTDAEAGDPIAPSHSATVPLVAVSELIAASQSIGAGESLDSGCDTRERRQAKRMAVRVPKQRLKAAAVVATLICCGSASIAFVAQGFAGIAQDASTGMPSLTASNTRPWLEQRSRTEAVHSEIKLAALTPTASPSKAVNSGLTLPPVAAATDGASPNAPRSMAATLRDKAIAAAVTEPQAVENPVSREKILPQLVKQPTIAMRPIGSNDADAREAAPQPNKEADAPPVIEYAVGRVGAISAGAASKAPPRANENSKPDAKSRQKFKAVADNPPTLPTAVPPATPVTPRFVEGEVRKPTTTYVSVLGLRIPLNASEIDRTWTSTFFDNPGQ